jgi:hypothetical protein
MGDSWRFNPNEDYTNDYDDNNGRGFVKFKHKKNKNKNRNNSYDDDNYERKFRHNKKRPNKNWR